MKKIYSIALTILIIFLTLASDGLVMGQPPAPPGGHGLDGNHAPGGSAPLDGGILYLLLAASVYGAFKLVRAFKRKKEAS